MTKKFIQLTLLLLALSLLSLPNAASTAQSPDRADNVPGPTVQVRLDPVPRQRYVAPPEVSLRRLNGADQAAGATIIVNYQGSGWTAEARNAFEHAVIIWESLVTSPVPIVVDAQFSYMGPGILGGAGPIDIWRNFPNASQKNTWYPAATANRLANEDLSPNSADIRATFNSGYSNWYFGTGSSTPPNKINFSSVVLHEIGHGLGFLGSMEVDDGAGFDECTGVPGTGCYGYYGSPMIYDLFTENGAGAPLLSFNNNSTALAGQLTGGSIFFNSPGAKAANGGSRVPLYAPATWQYGSSYSHLSTSYDNTPNALMTYSISQGETIYHPGAVALCMLQDMGWSLTTGEACGTAVIQDLTATNDGPTILGDTTRLTAAVSSGSDVTYEWDFGDGNSASGVEVSHKYSASGSYTAVVTATNAVSQEKAATVVIINKPSARIYYPVIITP